MDMTSPLQDRTYRQLFTAQVVALAGTGLSTIALALLAYDLAGGDAGIVLGAGSSLIQTPAGRLLKRSAHKGDRPAIYAAHFALSHACLIGATLGLTVAFTVLAFVALTSTAAALALWPAHDPVEVEHLQEALEHGLLHVHDEHHQYVHEGWEGQEPHRHPHRHSPLQHNPPSVVDLHHQMWPSR